MIRSWLREKLLNLLDLKNRSSHLVVECNVCRYLLFRNSAQKKTESNSYGQCVEIYFCPKHEVKWSHKSRLPISDGNGYPIGGDQTTYYLNQVECDARGKVIKKC